MQADLLTISDLQELTGINYRTIYRYIDRGLIEPVACPLTGSLKFLFNQKTVKELNFIRSLRKYVSNQVLNKIAKLLRSQGDNPFSEGQFLVIDKENGSAEVIKILEGNFIKTTGKNPGQLYLPLWNL